MSLPGGGMALLGNLHQGSQTCLRLGRTGKGSGRVHRHVGGCEQDGGRVGDEGLCVELCDCASDCSNTGFTCDPLSAANAAYFGRAGACFPPKYALDPISCDAGAVDAGADASTD